MGIIEPNNAKEKEGLFYMGGQMDVKERRDLIEYGLKMVEEGLTFSSGGNLSIYMARQKAFLITPSGMDYQKTKERDMVKMDLDGNILEGERKPSSEWLMHKEIYEKRDDINALIHTHSRYIGVLSTLGLDLVAVNYLMASSGVSRIPVANYETFGTEALAKAAVNRMGDTSKAVILSNHGLIAGGKTLKEAMEITRDLEFCAFLYVMALSTGKDINIIPDEKMQEVISKAKHYGQEKA